VLTENRGLEKGGAQQLYDRSEPRLQGSASKDRYSCNDCSDICRHSTVSCLL